MRRLNKSLLVSPKNYRELHLTKMEKGERIDRASKNQLPERAAKPGRYWVGRVLGLAP